MPNQLDLLLTKFLENKALEQKQSQETLAKMMSKSAEKAVRKRLDTFAEDTPTSDLLLKTETANKMQEEATIEPESKSPEQGKSLLSKLMISIGSGMSAAGGGQGLALIGNLLDESKTKSLSPEQQVATIQETQSLLADAGINATVGVTATGAPTISVAATGGIGDLPPEQQVQAYDLARKIGGVRGATNLLPSIVKSLKEGQTIDQVEDGLRFAGQSTEFNTEVRTAAQQLMVGKPISEQQRTFDSLDDLVTNKNTEGVKSYLKRMAVKNASTDQAQNVMGMERTVDLLGEIQEDLDNLERMGLPTGFWSGTIENMLAKVGQVQDPEKRRIATKIAVAVMQYRRSMTGVQFGMKEHAEYKSIFPNIDKVGALNTANIKALKDSFKGNVDKFYSLSMGEESYNRLFKGGSQLPPGYDPDEWEIVE